LISEPVDVIIPEELDPPVGGASILVIVRLLDIDIINSAMKKYPVDL
jgi:hypothetical protein